MRKYGKDWQYRVLSEHGNYGFVKVDLKEDGSAGNIIRYDDDETYYFEAPCGLTLKDLELDLERMAEALNKPALEKDN